MRLWKRPEGEYHDTRVPDPFRDRFGSPGVAPDGPDLVSIWISLAPLIFAAVQVDYFLRVPIAICGSAVIALILSRFRQREWVIHPVTIILSFVVALLMFISQLGV